MSDDDFQSAFYYPDEEETCDHEDAEVNILTGRLNCHRCGESMQLSAEQLRAREEFDMQLQQEFDRMCAEEGAPE